MKRWKKALSAFAVASVMCFSMAAAGCGGNDDNGDGGDTHEHTYATTWTTDANKHWHASNCEHTGLKKDEGDHADANNDGKCDTCEYEMSTTPEHQHTWANTWSSDATNHWHAATCEGHTNEKKDVGAHADANNDGKCDTCEYQMSTPPAASIDAQINVSDLSTLSDGAELKSGVGIKAVGSLTVENNSKKLTFAGEEVSVSKRLKLDNKLVGSSSGAKGLEVKLAKNATILVYAYSGTGGQMRSLALYDAEQTIIDGTTQCIGDGKNDILGVALFTVEANKTYYIGAVDSGINVYYIAVFENFSEQKGDPVAAKEASCTEAGNLAYSVTDYGRYIKSDNTAVSYAEIITPALGHTYSLVEGSIKVASADEEGSAQLVCGRNSEHVEDVVLPVLSSNTYTERPATGETGTYKFLAHGVEITFEAVGVDVVLTQIESNFIGGKASDTTSTFVSTGDEKTYDKLNGYGIFNNNQKVSVNGVEYESGLKVNSSGQLVVNVKVKSKLTLYLGADSTLKMDGTATSAPTASTENGNFCYVLEIELEAGTYTFKNGAKGATSKDSENSVFYAVLAPVA